MHTLQKPLPMAVPVAPVIVPAGEAEERELPVADIDPEGNARKHFDAEQLQALADNIAGHGLLNALIVYRDPETSRYRLIAGERRLRAVRLLRWPAVRARILKDRPDEAARRELALIDNLQRQDLSDIELGLECLDYIRRNTSTASALALKLGKHVSTVTRAVQLAQKLPADLHDLIRGGQLSPFAARHLIRLPDDDTKRRFARLYAEGKVKTAAELAAAIKQGDGMAAPATAGFTAEEGGVRIAVSLGSGKGLAAVEAALRALLKDLRDHGNKGVAYFQDYLARKAVAAKKAAEAQAAHDALAGQGG